jgi:hypothetical protein
MAAAELLEIGWENKKTPVGRAALEFREVSQEILN